jgi:hypothetical protein
MLTGLGLVAFAVYRRYDLPTLALVSGGLVPATLVSYFLLTNCPSSGGGGGSLLDGSDVVGGSAGPSSPSIPPAAVVLLFGSVLIVAVAALARTAGDDETFEPVEESDPEAETSDFARAAGRAADRIEDANVAVDNAVYRAWVEMTGMLAVPDPETTSPRDFAAAAIDIGIDEDHVRELTTLFTEVRYGDADPEEREERALAVLRAVETSYRDADERGGDGT